MITKINSENKKEGICKVNFLDEISIVCFSNSFSNCCIILEKMFFCCSIIIVYSQLKNQFLKGDRTIVVLFKKG